MANKTCDVIVIGCGGFGSSAMFHLARRGLKVVGIDRFHPPHAQGSSHGETRLIRKAYFEHPNYVPLLHRAWDLWDELSDVAQESLIEQRDLLMSGPAGSEVIEGARASAKLHHLPLENLTQAEATRRYPMFCLPEDHHVTVESTAGYLWSERCVNAHIQQAMALGAVLQTGEVVLSVTGNPSGIEVKTDKANYSAAAAVMTCGAWTGPLMLDYLRHITILRKTLFWYSIEEPMWTQPAAAPMFLLDLPEGQFYGPSSVDGRTVKIGLHSGGEPVADASTLVRSILPEDEPPTSYFVANRLRGISTKSCRSAVCMYSMTPDGHFLFDKQSDMPLVIGAGFSGHGFKFTSVLGEVAADLIQYGRSSLNIDFLSVDRFRS
jgi:sarcosine oxidase